MLKPKQPEDSTRDLSAALQQNRSHTGRGIHASEKQMVQKFLAQKAQISPTGGRHCMLANPSGASSGAHGAALRRSEWGEGERGGEARSRGQADPRTSGEQVIRRVVNKVISALVSAPELKLRSHTTSKGNRTSKDTRGASNKICQKGIRVRH